MSEVLFRSLQAFDTLHHASEYLAEQFDIIMSPDEAVGHFNARVILAKAEQEVFYEALGDTERVA